ncbi:hypothetical protein [Mycetocola zhujimingii]|uniref:Uncharacterized protein n=1 Tax=Mycetocola zhujimingii TaxID=2079792 RepID=A0A2U1TBR4_9MICO|nr:hypothetical protein [Mycetocola zhujimingii]PWC06337.1 hypothetical protein DF223_12080 [Mycetocola zhujimingii]
MPSYRVTISVGRLAPGVMPDSVLPRAAAAAAELVVVEASDLSVVAGSPRIVVRFAAEDAGQALRVGGHVVEQTGLIAEPLSWTVTARDQGRWYLVR